MDEKAPLPGHQHLTMAEQMRAMSKPATLTTSPVTGAVENPRRKFMSDVIAGKREANPNAAGHMTKPAGTSAGVGLPKSAAVKTPKW